MKLLISLALFIATNAFAADICSYRDTWDFAEGLKEQGIKASKISKNHKRFTFLEKEMIHLTISLQEWFRGVSREEALEQFGDMYEGKPGENAGKIEYYEIRGKNYALVHYWPGENEVGAFYEIKNGAYKLRAEINDSFIECK